MLRYMPRTFAYFFPRETFQMNMLNSLSLEILKKSEISTSKVCDNKGVLVLPEKQFVSYLYAFYMRTYFSN